MIERVRAVLVTPGGCMLAIRRDRPGRATYWVLPAGHVDPGDQSLEAALSREIREEIAARADIISLLYVLDSGAGDERQYFYLGRITSGTLPRAPARSSPSRAAVPTSWSRSH
jgi:8-oxo-dGTP pyrophosphatase MutT (NUDIX family)